MDVEFELNGEMPLLMCMDSIEVADEVKEWQMDPKNKNLSVPGDDRTPAWTWHGKCYNDTVNLVMPSANIAKALCVAATKVKLKGNTSFKQAAMSGMVIREEFCDFIVDGKKIAMSAIEAMRGGDFKEQSDKVKKMGFQLFAKRASVNGKKHIRVRPRFNVWKVRGAIHVSDPAITFQKLDMFFSIAGEGGLCDWRPTAPKSPGSFGMFTAKLKKV